MEICEYVGMMAIVPVLGVAQQLNEKELKWLVYVVCVVYAVCGMRYAVWGEGLQ